MQKVIFAYMTTILRNSYVFGPLKSRRLGYSLGINILPTELKICNFNCIYCECGWNSSEINLNLAANINSTVINSININPTAKKFPARNEIKMQLENKLLQLAENGELIDVITFSGNGEPTLHPDFLAIINDTIEVRNKFYPSAKISVLSNATKLLDSDIFEALRKIENPILKLDSANIETLEKINLADIKNLFQVENSVGDFVRKVTVEKIIEGMQQFDGNFILQIMFLRGEVNGVTVDNTTDEEILGLLEMMKLTKPRQVMIYPIDRQTPAKNLIKLSQPEMQKIACKFESEGFTVLYV